MVIGLALTMTDYDMNHPNGRKILRDTLMANGFFEYPENKPLWPVFDQSRAEGEQAMQVYYAIKLYDQLKTGRALKV